MGILSIQSQVVWGHVGNGAARFALERLGFEVWAVDTVRLSSQPGHGPPAGGPVPATELAATFDALATLGLFARCEAILTGYAGTLENGRRALEAVRAVKAACPNAPFLCDPVMGDTEEGLYVAPELFEFFKTEAIPMADAVAPNVFELGLLTGAKITDPKSALAAARRLLGMGPRLVLATSVPRIGAAGPEIGVVLATPKRAAATFFPQIVFRAKGTGDLLSALFLGMWLKTGDPFRALAHATAAVNDVIVETARVDGPELALIASQDRLLQPHSGLAGAAPGSDDAPGDAPSDDDALKSL